MQCSFTCATGMY